MRNKVYHTGNRGPINPICVDWCRNHDGLFACDFADKRLRNINVPLHRLLHIFPVGIIVPVKNAVPVRADNIAPLEPMHADTLIDDCPLFLHRYRCIRKLWDTSCVHRYIFISSQLLFNTLRRQDCGFAHHLFHYHDSAPVIQGNTGRTHRNQGN